LGHLEPGTRAAPFCLNAGRPGGTVGKALCARHDERSQLLELLCRLAPLAPALVLEGCLAFSGDRTGAARPERHRAPASNWLQRSRTRRRPVALRDATGRRGRATRARS
jgi:hypothetical protein